MVDNIPTLAKECVDVVSYVVVLGTLAGYLPAIAALFSIIWISIQFVDWLRRKYGKTR